MTKAYFKLEYFVVLLILILAVGSRAYRVVEKDSLFLDENLSVIISNYTDYGWTWPVVAASDEVKEYEGGELKKRIFSDDSTLKNVLYDVWNLRKTTRDTAHTNLYYSFLRISFLEADTADLGEVVQRAFWLNILFFIVGFICLYRLARLLFGNRWCLIVCTLAVAFLNPISISNTIFIREYQLQEAAFIALTYFAILFSSRIYDKKVKLGSKLEVACLFVATAFSLMAGYFGVVYVLMLWVGIFIVVLWKGQSKLRLTIKCFGAFVGSIFLVLCIYPTYFYNFFVNRGEEAFGKLSLGTLLHQFLDVIAALGDALGVEVLIFIFSALILSGVGMYIRRCRMEKMKVFTFYIMLCSIVWSVFCFYLAPVKEIRYIAASFPLVYLIFPFTLSFFNIRVQQVGVLLLVGFFIFKSTTEKNIYWGKEEVTVAYKDDIKTPLILGGVYSPWIQTALIPYYTDGRRVEFSFDMNDFEERINKYKEVYVVVAGEGLVDITIPSNYEIVAESTFNNEKSIVGEKYKVRRINNNIE